MGVVVAVGGGVSLRRVPPKVRILAVVVKVIVVVVVVVICEC